ncbi:hypothetical protein DENSPDRAFT_749128, partial [Dentipellis sp. KUC8613]
DLTERDKAILRQYSLKLKHYLTDNVYKDLPSTFPDQTVPSVREAQTRLAFLASFKPQIYDCCINSCICYTGPRKMLRECPECKEPRFNASGHSRKHFTYLPLIPRLLAMVSSDSMASLMRYRHYVHKQSPHNLSNVFDGQQYIRLCDTHVTIDDKELPHKFFCDGRDIALGLSTDGFAPFRHRSTTC